MLGGLCLASVAVSAGASADAGLTAVHRLLVRRGPVPMATDGILPIDAIPVAVVAVVTVVSVAVVAVVAVSSSVIYQGSVLVLAELADQLGFQS